MHSRLHNAIVLLATYVMLTRASGAFAHDGHGLAGSHWHATDVWGFVVVGALSATAIWISRKGK
ncbi:MAG: hypothetical protein V4858_01245 [Pseudomonadota bacterium]